MTKLELWIQSLHNCMIDYQKKHNIVGECIANSIFYMNCLKSKGINVKVKAVIARWTKNDCVYADVHMVVDVGNNKFIDPSFDVENNNALYFDTIHSAFAVQPEVKIIADDNGLSMKKTIDTFVKFLSCADRINNGEMENGEMLVADNKYYQKLVLHVCMTVLQNFKDHKIKIDISSLSL